MLKLLLTSPNINIDTPANNGATPLQFAVYNNFEDEVRILVEHGADVNILNVDHYNAFHIACKVGNLKIFKILLQFGNVDINCVGQSGYGALQNAVASGHKHIVKELLQEKNIDIHKENLEGFQALYVAAYYGYHEIVKMLLDAGADVNHANVRGAVALHAACGNGYADVVEVLLKDPNIDINAVDLKGMSCVHWAVMYGYIDCLNLLLKKSNINLDFENCKKLPALYYAIENNRNDMVRVLLEHGACCNKELDNKHTPLSFATALGFTDIVQELLIVGKADVNPYINYEKFQFWTPLDIALENNDEQLQQLLLAHGAVEFRSISIILFRFPCLVGNDSDQLISFIAPKKNKLKKQILATVKGGFSMSFGYALNSNFIEILNNNKIKVSGFFCAPSFPAIDKESILDNLLYFVFEKIDGKWWITDTNFSEQLKH